MMALAPLDSLLVGNVAVSPDLTWHMHLYGKGDSVFVRVKKNGAGWEKNVLLPHALETRLSLSQNYLSVGRAAPLCPAIPATPAAGGRAYPYSETGWVLRQSFEKQGDKAFVSAVFFNRNTLRVLLSGTLYTYEV